MVDSPSLGNNTILLRTSGTAHNLEFEKFVYTGLPVYPGMFVTTAGTPTEGFENIKYTFMGDATTDGWKPRMIAVENIYHGKTIDDPYEAGERMHVRILRSGDAVLTKITNLATDPGIREGLEYTYDANGWLRRWVSATDDFAPVVVSLESVNSPTLPCWTTVQII